MRTLAKHIWDPKIGSTTLCGRFCMEMNAQAHSVRYFKKRMSSPFWCKVCKKKVYVMTKANDG